MTGYTRSNDAVGAAAEPRHVPDWVILAIACLAQFMVVLDVSIVNVALPSIGRELHYSPTGLQWVVNAYVLTFAGFLLLGGRAADLFGRRRIYLLGLCLFTLASLLGGLAESSTWLTAARAAQGVGGAIVSPATLTIIVTTFKGVKLPKALGVWSAVAGAGGAAGSIFGGVLTAELSWRWVLFVNIPIGMVGVLAAVLYLAERRGHDAKSPGSLDFGGALTVTAGLGVLVYAIVGTGTHAWLSSYTLTWLGVAVALLAVFAVIELRVVSRPLVPFRMFRSRSVSGANAVMLLVGAAFFSMWYFLSLYMQNVLAYSALRAGLAFLPMALSVIVGAQISSAGLGEERSTPIAARRHGHRPPGSPGSRRSTLTVPTLVTSLAPVASLPLPWACSSRRSLRRPLPACSRGKPAWPLACSTHPDRWAGRCGLAALATIATDRTHMLAAGRRVGAVALTGGYARAFGVAVLLSVAALACSLVSRPRPGPVGERAGLKRRPTAPPRRSPDESGPWRVRGPGGLGPGASRPLRLFECHRGGLPRGHRTYCQQGQDEAGQSDPGDDPKAERVARGVRGRGGVPSAQERLGVGHGHAAHHGHADGAADLLRSVDQPRGEPCVLGPDAFQRRYGHRHERHGQAKPNEQVTREEVGDVLATDGDLRVEQHATGQEQKADRHDRAGAEARS